MKDSSYGLAHTIQDAVEKLEGRAGVSDDLPICWVTLVNPGHTDQPHRFEVELNDGTEYTVTIAPKQK